GTSMLLDRMCPGGGWNAGNGVALGASYAPYIDATSIALLALRTCRHEPAVRQSLSWLSRRLGHCPSPFSLAWGILALAAYRDVDIRVKAVIVGAAEALAAMIAKLVDSLDCTTLASSALALEALDGKNVFEVTG